MKTSNRITRLVDDLAGYWTEPVLEILKTAGKADASVQSEIETWHTLSVALQTELRRARTFGLATLASFDAAREQVFGRAISLLARKFNMLFTAREHDGHIREWMGDGRSTAAEHGLFGEIVREAASSAEFKSARRTDFVPRLQLAAVGG